MKILPGRVDKPAPVFHQNNGIGIFTGFEKNFKVKRPLLLAKSS